jgi:SAM-dependent methyltransferase
MMLAAGDDAELLYGGDRMWPSVRSGQRVKIEPVAPGEVGPGMPLVVLSQRIPDLLRVVRVGEDGTLQLRGDADPEEIVEVEEDAVLAAASLPSKTVRQGGRWVRRLWLELAEAMRGAPDDRGEEDPAATVLHKYDSQAPYYVASPQDEVSASLLRRIGARVPPGSRLLVVGSGAGRECYALCRAGYRVSGVDFAPTMIESARQGARERDLTIDFARADIREHEESPHSISGILFTYGVFSFLPRSSDRRKLLRKMVRWLAPGGVIFLSLRPVWRTYERLVLTLQWIRASGTGRAEWGDSHTRYLTRDGVLHRSFLHGFTRNRLREEVRAAGLVAGDFHEGHVELSVRSDAGEGIGDT